ncbi:sirohydrochlorin chelatase [Rhodoferax sediminis]|jgi:sirohydrochlorin cobaltochelatase|uniref:Cobalamin biosynthesis protein CbiX n=1 Tax=Rhodoferax sediminis TaxID=2509614 RepID=A0A515DAZ6_9BURK|nr:CbiX/SirB N-terminal domain-containing protein [Rhodoferax sediminis]QDL37584.1 cobalamin biosynthesis protein CbiX [Rhodoferax sediminis]
MVTVRGIVLLAHGSRDPLWRQPIERVAAHMREHDAQVLVACAYLELTEPDLAAATAQLLERGAGSIRVVPMFLGIGQHVRDDLPRLVAELKVRYPQIRLTLQPAIGEDARMIELMAQIALS